MRKGLLAPAAVLVLLLSLLVTVTPASAITGGRPDGDGHPYGALILVPGFTFCSGTLIDENVVLTAGHCTSFWTEEEVTEVWVTFDPAAAVDPGSWEIIPGGTWYRATVWATHPDYVDADWPYTPDFGVVILNQDVVGIAPALLPTKGLVETLIGTTGQTAERFFDVGYGQDGVWFHTPPMYSPPAYPYSGNFEFVRKVSVQRFDPSSLRALPAEFLNLKNVPSANHGGGCGGDSGSGIYAGSVTDTVVAIHIGGYRLGYEGQLCGRLASWNLRLDLPYVLDWLTGFVD